MMQRDSQAQSIMRKFASATGLIPPGSQTSHPDEPRRYLWTDAFAVCNYLAFFQKTGERVFLQEAIALVDQVHQILGHHRKDSTQSGWLSGLDEQQARLHPTRGGLRIGKRLNERQFDEPVDESLEWEQDGQYFHYLTKWMHALDCVSRNSGNHIYNQWALELAKVAHQAFTYLPATGGEKRMHWKMSIDLSRPLVASMGQHDPLDGLITYWQLEATAKHFAKTQPDRPLELTLKTEIEEMAAMCDGRSWASTDALGIGSLLTDAYKLIQLIDYDHRHETARLEGLLGDIDDSLRAFSSHNSLHLPAEHRLAFRELGLAIGLQAIDRMQQHIEKPPEPFHDVQPMVSLLSELSAFCPVHESIENFWLDPHHQSVSAWLEHADINNVMLATSLAPEGYLQLSKTYLLVDDGQFN
jgi:hypothetical protein